MKKLIFGAMSMGLLLTACSSESILEQTEQQRTDVDRTYFVKVNIHGDSDALTRAADTNGGNPDATTDFEVGTDEESAVSNVYFVFYDDNGNVVGNLVNVDGSTLTWQNGEANTVDKYASTVVQVEVPKSSNEPKKVICYINPIAPQSLQTDLQSIQTVEREACKTSRGFAMSNSVYYDNNQELQVAVNIAEGQLKETYEEAEAASNVAMDIYVDRYASKLTFELAQDQISDYETSSPEVDSETGDVSNPTAVSLTFKPQKWTVNAESKTMFMIKSFRKENPSTGQILAHDYTFGELNQAITAGPIVGNLNYAGSTSELSGEQQWIWNKPSYHRSYWEMSPAYFTENYPEVSSDVKNQTNQVYYSYDDLSTGDKGFDFESANKTQYFLPTTVGSRALTQGGNPRAAVASVIIVGQYDVTVGGTKYVNQTFYTYNKNNAGKDLVYFPSTENEGSYTGNSVITGCEDIVSRMISACSSLYYSADGIKFTPATKEQVLPFVRIAAPSVLDDSSEKKTNKVAARLRTLKLKDGVTSTGASCLYIASGNGYRAIGESPTYTDASGNTVNRVPVISLEEANDNLYQQIGAASLYENGMAYFNIPVQHYGWWRNGNLNRQEGKTDIEWKYVHVGDFGMVRNHSYKINVTGIEGLGSAIADPTDPIVPPADTETYYVKYRVNILKWAVVPTQSVKL